MSELLTLEELPAGFMYPAEFIRIVELGLLDLEPWQIPRGEALRWRHEGLADRYPERVLVPFAERVDNDDVACWSPGTGDETKVLIIHDFASPGWELAGQYPNFYAWLRQAIEDLIEFDD